ncbi:FHA domain-containing protein [bacterium]|nr:FHA domain-containing protein [bacterium]
MLEKNGFDKTIVDGQLKDFNGGKDNDSEIFLKDINTQKTYKIEKFPFIMGRSKDCNLAFNKDHKLSRIHCIIYKKNRAYIIEDLGSTNGTKLDNLTIKKAILKPGNVISIGDRMLVFILR